MRGLAGGEHRSVADDVRGVVAHDPKRAARSSVAASTRIAELATTGIAAASAASVPVGASTIPCRAPTIPSAGKCLVGSGSQGHDGRQGEDGAESFHWYVFPKSSLGPTISGRISLADDGPRRNRYVHRNDRRKSARETTTVKLKTSTVGLFLKSRLAEFRLANAEDPASAFTDWGRGSGGAHPSSGAHSRSRSVLLFGRWARSQRSPGNRSAFRSDRGRSARGRFSLRA